MRGASVRYRIFAFTIMLSMLAVIAPPTSANEVANGTRLVTAAQPDHCTPASDAEKCRTAWAKAHEKRELLARCLRKTGNRLAASANTLDKNFVEFVGSCSHERAHCMAAMMKAQISRSARADPWSDRRPRQIAMLNAGSRCDEQFETISARTIGPPEIQY